MNCVLITAIGSFSAETVIKGLKKENYNVIGCDIYPKELIANSVEVDIFYQSPYSNKEKEYISFLLEICKKNNVKFILPLTDVEIDILNKNREIFLENDVIICFSSKETIDICRNKKILEETLSKIDNVLTIPTFYAKNYINVEKNYPLVCKPLDGRSSQGLIYVNNDDEWENFLDKNDLANYIIQPYIDGVVVTVDILMKDKQNIVCVSRKEILRTSNGAGLSVYVFYDEKLNTICKTIAKALNVKGCVNFEFILDNEGDYHFIECNPRFSGGIAFSCNAGYDCIKNHMNIFKNKDIDGFRLEKNFYIVKRYTEVITKIEE